MFGIQHDGEYLTDPIAIKNLATSFFQQLLTAELVFPEEMDSGYLEDGLTDEDRRSLCVMPILEEVRETVFSIDPDSVAGPDGFGVLLLSQSGFVPGQLLSDNVLLVQELIHSLESRRPEAMWSSSLIWLRPMMGFRSALCGAPDDVLSSTWLDSSIHLVYADDLMIFTTTCQRNMELLRDFLRAYERVLGQMINGMKSSFIVGYQASSLQTQAMQYILGYQLKHLPVTYFGVLLYKGNRKRNAAKYRGVPFSTDDIILEVQRHFSTQYAAWILPSTQWRDNLYRAGVIGFIFRQIVPRAPSIVCWRAPSPSWFKLNTDGPSFGNPGLAGAAGIIRDLAGHVHFTYQVALGTGTSVLAELTVVWRGLELALTHGLAPLVVEVDATTVITLLQSRVSGKEANGAADHLAKEDGSLNLTRVLHHNDITCVLRGIL
ncbi:UNVERIFIED_CONTAM: putative ribonuclease H protein [Sesamum calycinum]|uniref:Ribonuclease H protein n=1 Tax=Sesamum calycinum TaxID=2727403 RepID=A0AAW2N1F4_9LAMI